MQDAHDPEGASDEVDLWRGISTARKVAHILSVALFWFSGLGVGSALAAAYNKAPCFGFATFAVAMAAGGVLFRSLRALLLDLEENLGGRINRARSSGGDSTPVGV